MQASSCTTWYLVSVVSKGQLLLKRQAESRLHLSAQLDQENADPLPDMTCSCGSDAYDMGNRIRLIKLMMLLTGKLIMCQIMQTFPKVFVVDYGEQARWALHHHEVLYHRTDYMPGIGELWLRWRLRKWSGRVSVPVLFATSGMAARVARQRTQALLSRLA